MEWRARRSLSQPGLRCWMLTAPHTPLSRTGTELLFSNAHQQQDFPTFPFHHERKEQFRGTHVVVCQSTDIACSQYFAADLACNPVNQNWFKYFYLKLKSSIAKTVLCTLIYILCIGEKQILFCNHVETGKGNNN